MWAVFFGAPPGVIYDPLAEPAGEKQDAAMDAAFVLAEHDPRRGTEPRSGTESLGTVELIALASEAEGPMRVVSWAEALECYGQRRCEACSHLERLTRGGVLRGLVHRGGLCEPTCSRSARSEPATASRRCRRVACHPLLVFTEVRGKWIFTSFVNSACTEGRDRHRGAAFGSAPEALRELARDEPPAAAALRAGLFGRGRVAECDGVARVRSEGAATTAGFA
jgi:hypothetical protein